METKLIDYMGNDNTVCQAARVSTGNHTAGYKESAGLINYLWREGHTSCFEHCSMTFYIKVPFFIARQIQRHRVFSYNEISGRYSELELEFWFPEEDRPLTNKGSGAYPELVQGENQEDLFYGLTGELSIISSRAEEMYLQLLGNGVATEIARAVLPLNTYTEFYMSGNLKNWLDFVTKRTVPNAQIEIVEIAKQIADEIKNKFPLVWEAYERNSNA